MKISDSEDCFSNYYIFRICSNHFVNESFVRDVEKTIIASILIIFFTYSILSTIAIAEGLTPTERVNDSPKVAVYVGVRDDAKPFSYIDITRNSETVIPGYSGYSVEVCRHVLKQMKGLRQYRNFEFKAHDIKATDRFKPLGGGGNLFMLCGPDSITQERLVDYWASQPFFLSGMTYAYLNPRSPEFPRGNYCGNIIGVVRGTTADTEGLPDIAERGLLMRFDKALNLEINKTSERVGESRKILRKLINDVIIGELSKPYDFTRQYKSLSEFKLLKNVDLVDLVNAVDRLAANGNVLAHKVKSLMEKQHQLLNNRVASSIVTDECPLGFSSLPVRKYENHDKGVADFCKGNVLYYMADYDILQKKTEENSDCNIVMERFTRSREVYGALFSKNYMFTTNTEANTEVEINAAGFYADFNNFLTRSMQGSVSDVEGIFSREFGVQKMSDELASFFDSFKIE